MYALPIDHSVRLDAAPQDSQFFAKKFVRQSFCSIGVGCCGSSSRSNWGVVFATKNKSSRTASGAERQCAPVNGMEGLAIGIHSNPKAVLATGNNPSWRGSGTAVNWEEGLFQKRSLRKVGVKVFATGNNLSWRGNGAAISRVGGLFQRSSSRKGRGHVEDGVLRRGATAKANAMAESESASDGFPEADSGFVQSKLAVFVSGGGSNFRALHSATLNNSIYGAVTVVVSDKPGCKGCDYAREHGLEVLTYPPMRSSDKQNANAGHGEGLSASELVEALRQRSIDFVLLAGYLKLLPPELVRAYPRSIVNIHPSLLPSFGGKGYYGMRVHEAVIKSGARFSGATIHFVDEKFDTGPIVAQRIVPVLSDDTPQDLAAKVLREEHLLYSEVVAALCEDRIFWRDDGVPLIRKSWNEAEYY